MTVTPSPMPQPGDPKYISVEEAARRDLARTAEFEARPHVVAKRKADREYEDRKKLEGALRKRALVTSTDYPWLKPDWDRDKVPLGFAKDLRPASYFGPRPIVDYPISKVSNAVLCEELETLRAEGREDEVRLLFGEGGISRADAKSLEAVRPSSSVATTSQSCSPARLKIARLVGRSCQRGVIHPSTAHVNRFQSMSVRSGGQDRLTPQGLGPARCLIDCLNSIEDGRAREPRLDTFLDARPTPRNLYLPSGL